MRLGIAGAMAFGLAACASVPDSAVTEVDGVRFVGRSFLPTDKDGAEVIECLVQAGGGLSDCTILSEQPAGMGFGEAALRAAAQSRVGAAQVGSKVRWTVRFREGPDRRRP